MLVANSGSAAVNMLTMPSQALLHHAVVDVTFTASVKHVETVIIFLQQGSESF